MPDQPPLNDPGPRVVIDLEHQTLDWFGANGEHERWPVSTALNGPGEANNSGCTPRGRHYVRALVGHGQPEGTVFVARRPTGETWTPELSRQQPGRDWILSRIIWLCGLEKGLNRGGRSTPSGVSSTSTAPRIPSPWASPLPRLHPHAQPGCHPSVRQAGARCSGNDPAPLIALFR